MKYLTLTLLVLTGVLTAQTKTPASGQDQKPAIEAPKPKTPEYKPTTDQAKDLRIAQLEAVTAGQAYQDAAQKLPEFAAFQQAMLKLTGLCASVQKTQGWSDEIKCNVNNNPITFSANK